MALERIGTGRPATNRRTRTPRSGGEAAVLTVVFVLLAASVSLAGEGLAPQIPPLGSAEPSAPGKLFSVGHMRAETSGTMTEDWFRRLQRFLESDRELRRALAEEGYGGVSMVSAEGYRDLVARMDQPSELDCVFCPAVAFCRQTGQYTVVFQLRGPNDRGRPPYIFQSGVVIVNSRHPLFRDPKTRDQQVPVRLIARDFASSPVALVSRYSAPGYIYPCNELTTRSGILAFPNRPIFCGSSEEVVKMVVSDAVGMGACERGAIEEVFRRYDTKVPAEEVLDVLLTTPGSPTDPVVFRSRFSPNRSELGKRLKDALVRFFATNRPGQIRLEDSDNDAFRGLRAACDEFDRFSVEMEPR
jgi:hypothetical protein